MNSKKIWSLVMPIYLAAVLILLVLIYLECSDTSTANNIPTYEHQVEEETDYNIVEATLLDKYCLLDDKSSKKKYYFRLSEKDNEEEFYLQTNYTTYSKYDKDDKIELTKTLNGSDTYYDFVE